MTPWAWIRCWTLEHPVAPHPSPHHTYTFLCLMDDMARQAHSPEVRQIILSLVKRADFHAIPHFWSFTGRMLRYSALDDSTWEVNPFQALPFSRLVPDAHEPVPFDVVLTVRFMFRHGGGC